jgi:glutaminase
MQCDYREVLREIEQELDFDVHKGAAATYIPELAKVNPNLFGLHLCCLNGDAFSLQENHIRFSAQSITKVFTLSMAMKALGQKVWRRVDVEPSGSAFNSLALLEYEAGIPRNPLINAGALVIADMLVSHFENPKQELLQFVRLLAGDDTIDYDLEVAASEQSTGYRNFAMANMLKSFGNMENEVEKVLDFYFHQCALSMSCAQLAQAFLPYANGGKVPRSKQRILTPLQTKRINALMMTCGFYDEAGEFSFLVGLPGKSGVGGGIVAVHPGEYSVAVWSPRLNKKGNSVLGMRSLELLTTKTGYSIF